MVVSVVVAVSVVLVTVVFVIDDVVVAVVFVCVVVVMLEVSVAEVPVVLLVVVLSVVVSASSAFNHTEAGSVSGLSPHFHVSPNHTSRSFTFAGGRLWSLCMYITVSRFPPSEPESDPLN